MFLFLSDSSPVEFIFYRCGTVGQSGSEMGGNTTDSASYSGAEDDEMERQFDADYDYVNMERISNMNKDQVCLLFHSYWC